MQLELFVVNTMFAHTKHIDANCLSIVASAPSLALLCAFGLTVLRGLPRRRLLAPRLLLTQKRLRYEL
jgi:hypothetical protein